MRESKVQVMQEPTDQDLAQAALTEDLLGANKIGIRLAPIKVEAVSISELIDDLRKEVETLRKPKKSKIRFTLTPEERKKRNRERRSKR